MRAHVFDMDGPLPGTTVPVLLRIAHFTTSVATTVLIDRTSSAPATPLSAPPKEKNRVAIPSTTPAIGVPI